MKEKARAHSRREGKVKYYNLSVACETCRQRKLKCTRDRPSCEYCRRLGLQCTYVASRRKPGPMPMREREREQWLLEKNLVSPGRDSPDSPAVEVGYEPPCLSMEGTRLRPVHEMLGVTQGDLGAMLSLFYAKVMPGLHLCSKEEILSAPYPTLEHAAVLSSAAMLPVYGGTEIRRRVFALIEMTRVETFLGTHLEPSTGYISAQTMMALILIIRTHLMNGHEGSASAIISMASRLAFRARVFSSTNLEPAIEHACRMLIVVDRIVNSLVDTPNYIRDEDLGPLFSLNISRPPFADANMERRMRMYEFALFLGQLNRSRHDIASSYDEALLHIKHKQAIAKLLIGIRVSSGDDDPMQVNLPNLCLLLVNFYAIKNIVHFLPHDPSVAYEYWRNVLDILQSIDVSWSSDESAAVPMAIALQVLACRTCNELGSMVALPDDMLSIFLNVMRRVRSNLIERGSTYPAGQKLSSMLDRHFQQMLGSSGLA